MGGLDAQRQLRTRSFTVALQLCCCQSEMPARRDLRAMLPMLAAEVCLYGAGLRFHSGLDAQRQLRTLSFTVALQLCCCQSEMPARRDLRAMLPMLAAKVYLSGAGLRFRSGLDAQRHLRTATLYSIGAGNEHSQFCKALPNFL